MDGYPIAKPTTRYRSIFFFLLLVRAMLVACFPSLSGVLISVGIWPLYVFFFVVFVLGWLALREQRGNRDVQVRNYVIVPMVLIALMFTFDTALRISGGMGYENGGPSWFVVFVPVAFLSIALEPICAVCGLVKLLAGTRKVKSMPNIQNETKA